MENDFNARLNEVIRAIGITKTKFAEQLNISQAFLSQLTAGQRNPSDRTISDICRVFGVDEHWLRFGSGEMFRQRDRGDEIEDLVRMLLGNEMQPELEKLIMALKKSTPEQIKVIYDFCLRVAAEKDP